MIGSTDGDESFRLNSSHYEVSNQNTQLPSITVPSTDSDDDDESVVSSDTSAEVHEIVIANSEVFNRQANRSAFFKNLKDDTGIDSTSIDGEVSSTRAQVIQSGNRIIDRVRDYQQELFERAKQENIVAV